MKFEEFCYKLVIICARGNWKIIINILECVEFCYELVIIFVTLKYNFCKTAIGN